MKSFTTKIMALGLTAIMLTGAVTACKTTKTGGASEMKAQTKQEQAAEANSGKQIAGGWTIPESSEAKRRTRTEDQRESATLSAGPPWMSSLSSGTCSRER